MKYGVLNYTKEELQDKLIENGFQKFRAEQIMVWIYRFGKKSFSEMKNISKAVQVKLEDLFYIYQPEIKNVLSSADGTLKFLLKLFDNNTVETVFIPENKRNTICVSSQIGCAIGCKFCNTGQNGFVRNLSTEEIISQFLTIKDYLKKQGLEHKKITNIVFMGMGEPLLNYNNVSKSISNMMFDKNEGISKRKITVSTSGISSILMKIAKDFPCKLAISLHAPNDEIRSDIMPINKTHNIESLISACKEYSRYHKYLKITFEYLLLGGINDSKECAHELANLLKKTNGKVNLLEFNFWKESEFKHSLKTKEFSEILESRGIQTSIRTRRGEDIMAACGQLSSNLKQ
ncbi:MAG: 23S rRNA (adenine(2503)-C(2))-methyltransferase RlmN [Holosporales bacterium]|jgi:23S rRNA (adenine2503-C2)-methyltransferase|nr:23S rRNA (adenine(2503)-C(2))-methyltransferase RlmN [Holosporales bacterium]